MTRILFVHNSPQPFVIDDLKLLRERWEVIERYEQTKKINPLSVARDVSKSALVFCWFASWHSLLPALFARALGKPSVVVIGGYDTANLPEAGYGSQRGGARQRLSRAVIANAAALLVNSQFGKQEAIANARADPAKITVAYHGVQPFASLSTAAREPIALTVGNVWHENLLRKGLLPFVQASKFLPDTQFIVVGKWRDDSIDRLRSEAGPNVQFTSYLALAELEALYQRASVYVQASLHEAFGLSVAEAMSAGCIPVVTRAGALPEVVGDTGVYADSNRPESIAAGIKQALGSDPIKRIDARQRVLTEFTMDRRRQILHGMIDRLLS